MLTFRSKLACACLVILFVSVPVLAQDANENAIEEVQVTATRRPVPEMSVSAALTIVTADEISRVKLVTDALAAQPGVYLQQTTPGQGAAIIRGLKGSEVLHLVDGMRLNNAIFRNAPTQYFALVAPGTLDRIEVLRGAPASLYGSDAVGGVVQALSRRPGHADPNARRAVYVAFDTADLSKIARGSMEFGDARAAVLVSGEYLDTGSRRTGSGERLPVDGYQSKGGRLALSLAPNEHESWLFDLQAARQPLTPRVDELIPGFGQEQPSSSEFFFAPNDRLFAHVRHTRDDWLWDADWSFDAAWQRIVDDRISRGFDSDVRRYENNSSDLLGLTMTASGEFTAGSWILGAEFYHDTVDSRRIEELVSDGTTEIVASRFPDGSSVEQAAVFGSVLRPIGRSHSISAGLRYSAVDSTLPATGSTPKTSPSQSDFSADLGWISNIADNTQLTANLGYGFRAPNVFDLGTLGERPGNRFNIPNPVLESERITQFDLGIRHRGQKFDLSLVGFVLHYTDRIASVITGDITEDGRDITQSRNIEQADIHGVEAAASWWWSDAASLEVVVNYLRGEQADISGVTVAGDRIPPLNGRVSFRYSFSDFLALEPYLVFAGNQDRLSPRDVRDVRINPDGTVGWMTANVAAEWRAGEQWLVMVGLENILDKHYRVHGSGVDAVGRNLFASFRVTW
jgi:outer membrane receptor protein involved in Fe transport